MHFVLVGQGQDLEEHVDCLPDLNVPFHYDHSPPVNGQNEENEGTNKSEESYITFTSLLLSK